MHSLRAVLGSLVQVERVVRVLQLLHGKGRVPLNRIGVITFYRAQVCGGGGPVKPFVPFGSFLSRKRTGCMVERWGMLALRRSSHVALCRLMMQCPEYYLEKDYTEACVW
jgi:hypothetical protein